MRTATLSLAALLAGCATTAPGLPLTPAQLRRVDGQEPLPLVTRGSAEAAVLRTRAHEVPAGLRLRALAAAMEHKMHASQGVGIAGPQVGVPLRVAVLLLGYRGPTPRAVFVRNPVIVERSDETMPSYEGCLSVPGVGGLVKRNRWVRVRWLDLQELPQETRAEGPDAVLWQHELDHLDGILYVDRLQGEPIPAEEMRRRRKELEQRSNPVSAPSQRERWISCAADRAAWRPASAPRASRSPR
jgi:peptide deformylase